MKCFVIAVALCGLAFASTISAMSVLTGGKECRPSVPEEGVIVVVNAPESDTHTGDCKFCKGLGACHFCGKK
ncbi:hypothetical protein PSHT_04033 [Puccinia striiformis]|uniref:Secreted protein n=1 Tax=Puccinia striiformis TaxID=27350 RepID=A0A2S4WDR5_9BASI|nr:hypothetical protein PSHT_04033 [Puccinia striiformis]